MICSPLQIVLGACAIGLGAAIQGTAGFGMALIAAPLLALVNPALAPAPMIVAGGSLTLCMAWRERHAIEWRQVGLAGVGLVPGTVAGALAVSSLAGTSANLLFGSLILLGVVLSLLGCSVALNAKSLGAGGLLCGFMSTVAGVGGPPIALLYQCESGPTIRANLATIFCVGNGMALIGLWFANDFGPQQAAVGLAMIPGVLAGLWASCFTGRLLGGGRARWAVLSLSSISALALIAHSI